MNKYKKIIIIISFWVMGAIFVPSISFGQDPEPTPVPSTPMLNKLQAVGGFAGYDSTNTSETTLLDLVGMTIGIGLGLLGVIFVILIIIAGYNWMTAAGDQEKITKAGSTIRSAIIGLLIVVAAYAIWTFISTVIIGDSGSGSTSTLIGS
ncbi:MAG TPA: hypothetical protein PK720_02145 [bacterium]|nr:hypothetical protein [bacterium]